MKNFLLVLLVLISACASPPQDSVRILESSAFTSAQKVIMPMTKNRFTEDMSAALSRSGFQVTSARGLAAVQVSPKYGYYLDRGNYEAFCLVKAASMLYDFTLTIVEISTGKEIAIIKKRGLTESCLSEPPVYDSLANQLTTLWPSRQ